MAVTTLPLRRQPHPPPPPPLLHAPRSTRYHPQRTPPVRRGAAAAAAAAAVPTTTTATTEGLLLILLQGERRRPAVLGRQGRGHRWLSSWTRYICISARVVSGGPFGDHRRRQWGCSPAKGRFRSTMAAVAVEGSGGVDSAHGLVGCLPLAFDHRSRETFSFFARCVALCQVNCMMLFSIGCMCQVNCSIIRGGGGTRLGSKIWGGGGYRVGWWLSYVWFQTTRSKIRLKPHHRAVLAPVCLGHHQEFVPARAADRLCPHLPMVTVNSRKLGPSRLPRVCPSQGWWQTHLVSHQPSLKRSVSVPWRVRTGAQ